MITEIKVNPNITLIKQTGVDGKVSVDGYTEILLAFREFTKSRPYAEKCEEKFDPTPWTQNGARPFIHVKNDELPALYTHWEEQLKWIITKESSPAD